MVVCLKKVLLYNKTEEIIVFWQKLRASVYENGGLTTSVIIYSSVFVF